LKRVSTLVSPVSTQVLPVVVTALTLKPERLVLLSTRKVDPFARMIERALEARGVEVERREVDPYDFSSISSRTSDLKGSLFLLNCGTKFTAVNLYRLFPEASLYYLPTGEIVDFDGNAVAKAPEDLVDVELHAAAYGFKILGERRDWDRIKERAPLTYAVASNLHYQHLLTDLFRRGVVSSIPSGDFLKLLLKFSVVRKERSGYRVLDKDYAGGKWLEELVALELLKAGFYDARLGVVLEWFDSGVTNEVDVLGVKNNRLYLFSCKSGKNSKSFSRHLYEVEELAERIGGDFGRSFLVVSDEVAVENPPSPEEFPGLPPCSYRECRERWEEFYATPQGKEYSKRLRLYRRYSALKKRARLLGVEVLPVRKVLEGLKCLT